MGTPMEDEHYTLWRTAIHTFLDQQYLHALQLLGEGSRLSLMSL